VLLSAGAPTTVPTSAAATSTSIPTAGLIVDLDADKGVKLEDGDRVAAWENQVHFAADVFKATRRDGRPTLRRAVPELDAHPAIVFEKQELLNNSEDAFDDLIRGTGYTWCAVIAPHKQVGTLQDVNSFFGNLKNGGNYEGFWAGFNDDNTLWMGSRNGVTFGRWNSDNPKVLGPKLEVRRFYVVAGRMGAGTGTVQVELFVDDCKHVSAEPFPVNPKADSSKMAIGQERDATNHPGKESFKGEIGRILFWDRPLSDDELAATISAMTQEYGIR